MEDLNQLEELVGVNTGGQSRSTSSKAQPKPPTKAEPNIAAQIITSTHFFFFWGGGRGVLIITIVYYTSKPYSN